MRGQREYCSFFITEFHIFHLFLSPQRLIVYLFHFRFEKYNRGQDRCHLRPFSISGSATLLTFQRSPHIIRVHSAIKKRKNDGRYRDPYNLLVSQRRCVKPCGAADAQLFRTRRRSPVDFVCRMTLQFSAQSRQRVRLSTVSVHGAIDTRCVSGRCREMRRILFDREQISPGEWGKPKEEKKSFFSIVLDYPTIERHIIIAEIVS